MPSPWSPMQAPPLPLRDDPEWNTCTHAYLAEECFRCWLDREKLLLKDQIIEDTIASLRAQMFTWFPRNPGSPPSST